MPEITSNDTDFIRRAIDLAMRGRGGVEPNPMVGCVIVKNGKVIGEGWHLMYGGPHAEPNALAACTESPAGATAYVTLEPCCHITKRTPPCVPQLIEAGLTRIVIGCVDPNPLVHGGGADQLRGAGLAVDIGLLEAEARQLAAPFFARIKEARPYITLKWAQSADGKVAGPGGARAQISNALSTRAVHELRARCDHILVGINTVLADDPLLTPRGVPHSRQLTRVVLDRNLRTPPSSCLIETASDVPLHIFCSDAAYRERGGAREALETRGAVVEPVEDNADGTLSLSHVVRRLGDCTHLLVEPGPTLARSFFDSGLVDRVWVIRSPARIGDLTAPSAPDPPRNLIGTGTIHLDGDSLTEYLNPSSRVFFAPRPSADFRLARNLATAI